MKAARFHARRDVRVDDVPKPSDIGPDEVLVRNEFCGICGSDLHEYADGPIFISSTPNAFSGASIPQILGHEFSGVIESLGPDVKHLKMGDRVSIQPHLGPLDGYFGVRGLHFLAPRGAATGMTWSWRGFAEYAVMKAYATVRMPDTLTFQQGAMVEPAAVAVTAIDRSGLETGGSILISGAGPIGALAALAAAAAAIDPASTNVSEFVRDNTFEGLGCDASIECAGHPKAIADCLGSLRPCGTVVLVGLTTAKVELSPFDLIVRNIRLQGSLCYPTTLWPRIYSMIENGRLPVAELVDAEIGLGGLVKDGFEPLLNPGGSMMKILVKLRP
jgi:(R,R)-butanediol dehydrogenase/meso-butanediol dehydrogenase/diacetyl reductase